ncbi:metallophosphoesterase [Crocinitomix catalasitica]|uniref:metallophosphoesterase n=1 Tax=Crocinitomix catalasitica TaxID=184607 RepID=UPI000481B879|nr:metallophosphoesterase [Crocinitomix catalasitica]
MHSRFSILPFIIVGILFLLQGYAYNGLSWLALLSDDVFSTVVQTIHYGLFAVAIASLLIIFAGGNRLSKSLRNFFFAFVFIDLFTLLTFDLFLLLDDIRRLFTMFFVDENPRSVILIYIGLVISILPAILFILGMIIGPYRYKVRRTSIEIKHLPASFKGLKIVQISDIHSGSFYNPKAVQRGVDLILQQKADIIVFTGDLVNDDATEMDPYISIFSQLKAPLGVYSILGNHDYGDYVQWPSKEAKAKNLEDLKGVHKKMGWRLLLDEHLYLEKGQDKIGLIGVQNWGKGFHQVGDLAKASAGCEAPVKILLSHDPSHWDAEVITNNKDINLTLSGHTHGAQMGIEWGKLKWSPIQLRYKNWAGLYQNADQYLYINRGFGFLGYPGRLGIWPEITVLELK